MATTYVLKTVWKDLDVFILHALIWITCDMCPLDHQINSYTYLSIFININYYYDNKLNNIYNINVCVGVFIRVKGLIHL